MSTTDRDHRLREARWARLRRCAGGTDFLRDCLLLVAAGCIGTAARSVYRAADRVLPDVAGVQFGTLICWDSGWIRCDSGAFSSYSRLASRGGSRSTTSCARSPTARARSTRHAPASRVAGARTLGAGDRICLVHHADPDSDSVVRELAVTAAIGVGTRSSTNLVHVCR